MLTKIASSNLLKAELGISSKIKVATYEWLKAETGKTTREFSTSQGTAIITPILKACYLEGTSNA